jgi:extradiol dioxygenase family protein
MFTYTTALSGFAVDDIDKARQFYGETLGVPVSEENGICSCRSLLRRV